MEKVLFQNSAKLYRTLQLRLSYTRLVRELMGGKEAIWLLERFRKVRLTSEFIAVGTYLILLLRRLHRWMDLMEVRQRGSCVSKLKLRLRLYRLISLEKSGWMDQMALLYRSSTQSQLSELIEPGTSFNRLFLRLSQLRQNSCVMHLGNYCSSLLASLNTLNLCSLLRSSGRLFIQFQQKDSSFRFHRWQTSIGNFFTLFSFTHRIYNFYRFSMSPKSVTEFLPISSSLIFLKLLASADTDSSLLPMISNLLMLSFWALVPILQRLLNCSFLMLSQFRQIFSLFLSQMACNFSATKNQLIFQSSILMCLRPQASPISKMRQSSLKRRLSFSVVTSQMRYRCLFLMPMIDV